ncbi:MAG: glycerophosphodiester phosphodiesterase [Candidatus Marinimicrobia bacterium]|nr:glycerophosphodiester phosphodiesterase [Candidatus Neomarinimicrobiota bacterium]
MRKYLKILITTFYVILFVACSKVTTSVVTAHRGGAGIAPENTMAAMKKALELGAGFSELDVQETSDGVLILLHDSTLERTAGVDLNIWEMPYDSLVSYEVGSWFAPEFAGEPIPKLADVMDAVKGKMKLNIELKMNGHEKFLIEKVIDLINEKDFRSECIITSFDLSAIKKVRQLDKDLKVGYIFSKYPEDEDVFTADVDLLSVKYKLVDEEFIRKAHANNKAVHIWTVNDPEMMKKFIDWGVNSIITDYPDKLLDLL